MSNTHTKNSKTWITLTLAAVAVFAVAADAVAGQRGHGGGKQTRFERLDVSGDGYLDVSELQAPAIRKAGRKFDRKDTDDSGFLSLEEYSTGRHSRDFSGMADEIVACVAELKEDTGEDRIRVPDADRFRSPAERFADVDEDGDEMLSLDEVEAAVSAGVEAGFAAADTSGDSLLTQDEYRAHRVSTRITHRAVRACVIEIQSEDEVI